jgi:hypothetical protein
VTSKATFLTVFVLALAVLAAPVSAQFIGRTTTVAKLGACQNEKAFALVTDATNATTLGAGGGSASVFVNCASGSWAIDEVAAVADLTGYVLDSEAAQVSIEASGAGNDVTLTAADDVILVPADALTVTSGGAAAITTTAGAIGLTAGGTTQDITLTSVDDVILVPADALTATVGGAAAVTTTAGAITLTAGGTTQDISLISVDQVIVDGAGGDDELVIDDDSVAVGAAAAFYVAIAAAPPVACAAGTKGALYYDSDINKLCLCNATNYVLVNDDSTTTGCS